MSKLISPLDLSPASRLVNLPRRFVPTPTPREWGALEYAPALALTASGAAKLISPLDLAGHSKLVNKNAGRYQPTSSARGMISGTFREWGALEYDSALTGVGATTKAVSSCDLSAASQLLSLNSVRATNKDARGTAVVGSVTILRLFSSLGVPPSDARGQTVRGAVREWGALEYDPLLSLGGGGGAIIGSSIIPHG